MNFDLPAVQAARKELTNSGLTPSPWVTFETFRDEWFKLVDPSTPYGTIWSFYEDYLTSTALDVPSYIEGCKT